MKATNPRLQKSLPKFVVADDGAKRDFVIHLHEPMFALEIGSEPVLLTQNASATDEELKRLVKDAAAFFLGCAGKVSERNRN